MKNKLQECVFCGALLSKKESYSLDDTVDFPKRLLYKFEDKNPLVCYDCMEKRNRQIRRKLNPTSILIKSMLL